MTQVCKTNEVRREVQQEEYHTPGKRMYSGVGNQDREGCAYRKLPNQQQAARECLSEARRTDKAQRMEREKRRSLRLKNGCRWPRIDKPPDDSAAQLQMIPRSA